MTVKPERRKFTLRLQERIAVRLEDAARDAGHSLNHEITLRLKRSLEGYRQ